MGPLSLPLKWSGMFNGCPYQGSLALWAPKLPRWTAAGPFLDPSPDFPQGFGVCQFSVMIIASMVHERVLRMRVLAALALLLPRSPPLRPGRDARIHSCAG